MTLQSRVGDLVVAIATDIKQLRTWLTGSASGALTALTTTDKTSIVSAINEINAKPSAVASSTTVAGVAERATDAEALAMASSTVDLAPSNIGAIVNVPNGLLKLDGSGKVSSSLLPAYVDDVLEYANLAGFPGTGTAGIIYVDLTTNKTYRWGGSAYAEISASPGSTDAVPEGSTNLYYTNGRADTRADSRISALVGNTDTDFVAAYNTAKA